MGEAAKILRADHKLRTRVVSMPCQEAFLRQDEKYRRSILPGNIPTLSVEASSEHGWHRFSHAQIAMSSFGMSGPEDELFEMFGFGVENIALRGKELQEFYQNIDVPDLNARPVFPSILQSTT